VIKERKDAAAEKNEIRMNNKIAAGISSTTTHDRFCSWYISPVHATLKNILHSMIPRALYSYSSSTFLSFHKDAAGLPLELHAITIR
jgi:hypothetical protein